MNHPTTVTIQEVMSTGLRVLVEATNQPGFISRREMTWDRRFDASFPNLRVGEQIQAIPLREKGQKERAELSLRRLVDPWQDAKEQFRVDDILVGTIVNVRNFGIFVQLAPGIDAIVRPKDIPHLRHQLPKDVVAIGDKVQGVITEIDYEREKIEFDILKRLKMVDEARMDRSVVQYELFIDQLYKPVCRSLPEEQTANLHLQSATQAGKSLTNRKYVAPLQNLERILIIDDSSAQIASIRDHLSSIFDVEIDAARSCQEALASISTGPAYDLAIVDMNLGGEYGPDLASTFLKTHPKMAVLFASTAPVTQAQQPRINGQLFPFTHKSPEEIEEWVHHFQNGYWEETDHKESTIDEQTFIGRGSFIRQLGFMAFAQGAKDETLNRLLAQLQQETGVSQVMIVEVDSSQHLASIMALHPPLTRDLLTQCQDGLYYSPVRIITEEQREISETQISAHAHRYRNFFPLLGIRTALGIPLVVPNMPVRHGLLLLNDSEKGFDEPLKEKARVAGQFAQVILERSLMLEFMERYAVRYAQGQLLSSMFHELSTKIDALSLQATRIQPVLQKAQLASSATDQSQQIDKALGATETITDVVDDISELIQAYARIAQGETEAINVNALVNKVQRQMATKARDASIEIRLDLEPNLPAAQAIQSRLEQIIFNLVLNGIQQMEKQAKFMQKMANERRDQPLLQRGVLVIQTHYAPEREDRPVQIFVIDSGPGISRHRQEEIFRLDTSSRAEGQGLGLFISRNLVESMGGDVRLVDSVMFMGSAFAVDLLEYR
ncbi:MAG: S1 RNA-binding domain-containing protein [Chloroflexota bacterium]